MVSRIALPNKAKACTITSMILCLLFVPAARCDDMQDWNSACSDLIKKAAYPKEALSAGLQGGVSIVFELDDTGRPSNPEIEGHATLADAAWDAIERARFPAMCRGKRTSASFWFYIEGNFWKNSKTTVCHGQPSRISVISSAKEIDCGVWARAAPETAPRGLIPVTVCEVLSDPGAFHNRNVALLGRSDTTIEGWWLSEDNCATQLKTDDYTWGNDVWVEGGEETAPNPPSNHFAVDPYSLGQKLAKLKRTTELRLEELIDFEYDHQGKFRTARKRNVKQHWEIVFGRIETRKNLRAPHGNGPNRDWGNGFGHLNGSPVQIVVKNKNSFPIAD